MKNTASIIVWVCVVTFIALKAENIKIGQYWVAGVNEKLLTQHFSGLVTKYKLFYVSKQGRAGARFVLGLGLGLDILIC